MAEGVSGGDVVGVEVAVVEVDAYEGYMCKYVRGCREEWYIKAAYLR